MNFEVACNIFAHVMHQIDLNRFKCWILIKLWSYYFSSSTGLGAVQSSTKQTMTFESTFFRLNPDYVSFLELHIFKTISNNINIFFTLYWWDNSCVAILWRSCSITIYTSIYIYNIQQNTLINMKWKRRTNTTFVSSSFKY